MHGYAVTVNSKPFTSRTRHSHTYYIPHGQALARRAQAAEELGMNKQAIADCEAALEITEMRECRSVPFSFHCSVCFLYPCASVVQRSPQPPERG